MSELKPCPFCGSKDVRTIFLDSGVSWVECSDCSATVGSGGHACDRNREEDLIDDWNQRDTSAIEAAVLRRAADECKANYTNRFGNIVKGISYNGLIKLARRLENGDSHER